MLAIYLFIIVIWSITHYERKVPIQFTLYDKTGRFKKYKYCLTIKMHHVGNDEVGMH